MNEQGLISKRHAPSALRMSSITLAELRFGVAKSQQRKRAASNLRVLLGKVSALPFDDSATERYGDLRTLLEKRGSPIGPLDTLIAAHALSLGYVLATHNARISPCPRPQTRGLVEPVAIARSAGGGHFYLPVKKPTNVGLSQRSAP
jgi:predicted nucleic acid-binding protein